MKGMLFTEFLELVETQFGLQVVDKMIEKAQPASGGAYTTVGNYPHEEMISMVIALHHLSNIPIKDLMKAFGKYLFSKLATMHPEIIKNISDPFDLLQRIEETIHVEVKKLYSDARPPMFETVSRTNHQLVITYQSLRKLGDVAEGLILGCGEYYRVNLSVEQIPLEENESKVKFCITKN
jgi:hypothetical protein